MSNTSSKIKSASMLFGPLSGLLVYFLLNNPDSGLSHEACITAGVTVWTAMWWVFEPIPIPATSLLPIAVFPLLGILSHKQISESYGHWLILLLMGGFILSTAMERSGAHRRIALSMIRKFGQKSDKRLVFAFMFASATLSMWISNTATTLMLLPIVIAIADESQNKKLGISLLLGIAYAANIGGLGTPIGTPPNLIFVSQYKEFTQISIGFLDWMKWGCLVVVIFVPIMGVILTRPLRGKSDFQIPHQGPWTAAEKRVLIVFSLTALAWITRKMGGYGWSELLDLKGANDATVALLAVVLLFIIPDGKGARLLDWKSAEKIPWGLLLLFSGGLCIGKAFTVTGLSTAIGNNLDIIQGFSIFFFVLCMCLLVTFLTEITSNTATTAILMPILGAAASSNEASHMVYMLPAALSASCAFMMPVATAPNAIVYSSGRFKLTTMIKNGFLLNLIGVIIIGTLCTLMN
jgi:solute carrier family 13 (sodium-dependent dicarboxylate transporter), member 2/3/5